MRTRGVLAPSMERRCTIVDISDGFGIGLDRRNVHAMHAVSLRVGIWQEMCCVRVASVCAQREPKEQTMLVVEDVHASYGKKEVLRGVSFSVSRGEITALLGGNGSGKSTTLRTIAGLLLPGRGSVRLDGRLISGMLPHQIEHLGVRYLLQGGRVFPNLSVRDNLRVAASRVGSDEKSGNTADTLTFDRLGEFWRTRAGLLSGGERQMLAIEMVLRQKPRLLLLDEPFAALSPDILTDVVDRVASSIRAHAIAAVVVEQKVPEAMGIADRALYLHKGRLRPLSGVEA